MRDLARFGLLFTPSYSVVSNRKIISDEYLEFLRTGANPNLIWRQEDGSSSYPLYQWGGVYSNDWLTHGGWGGQGLMVSPSRDVVAVFTSYSKEDHSELQLEPLILDMLNTVFSEISPAAQ
jgi:CubicO group peptidase (beta-lactamase class C family)